MIGSGPLPGPGVRTMGFPSLRTAQLAAGLLIAGHDVRIGLLVGDDEAAAAPRAWRGPRPMALEAVDVVRTDDPAAVDRLRGIRREFEPTAIVTAGPFLPMALGAAVVGDEPLWVDVPGDPMAEAQARAAADVDDDVLRAWRDVYIAGLKRGDAFSVIGARQRAALLGALGLSGRLVGAGLGDPLVRVVPGSVEPSAWAGDAPAGLDLPPDAVVLLFSGGWNTWLDVEALTQGVLGALDARTDLHFVATGGGISGHHDGAYASFQAAVAASPHAERVHLLGWVDAARLASIHRAAHVAVCVDRPCHEAELGARTRLLDAVHHGLQIASTVACEQVEALRGREGFTELPQGDGAGVATALAGVTAGSVDWDGDHSIQATTAALVRWAEAPTRAPVGFDFEAADDAEVRALRQELDSVHATPTWRLLSRLQRALRG